MVQCSIYTVYTHVCGIQNRRILVVSDIWVHNEQVRKSKSYEKNGILHMYLPSSSDTSLKVLSSNTDRGPPLRWFTGQGSLDCFGAATCSRFPWLPIVLFVSSSSCVALLLSVGDYIYHEGEKILLPTTRHHSKMRKQPCEGVSDKTTARSLNRSKQSISWDIYVFY